MKRFFYITLSVSAIFFIDNEISYWSHRILQPWLFCLHIDNKYYQHDKSLVNHQSAAQSTLYSLFYVQTSIFTQFSQSLSFPYLNTFQIIQLLSFVPTLYLKMGKDDSNTDDKQIKINKWDHLALKNTLDDAVKEVFITKYNHIEDFSLIDCRLLICTFAVLVAGFALGWDFFNPFPKSRFVLTVCVALYFITMGAITLYTTYMEKGIFAVTLERDESGFNPDVVWEASSYIKKHTGMYYLTIIRKDPVAGDIREREISKSVANYFDDEGTLCQEIIENEVTKIREAVLKLKKIE